ncbi:vanadium-dependent haloperoxidase [Segetibacter aerophilus]|uniref:vanadium-dependent haloperoxidase n=1 Tax=Segetibacter aerophilus TaxID=670293 RepID=UPI0011BEB956|nr:vanadium-dependent haloperoxidase [Segetibacter aerophilus]
MKKLLPCLLLLFIFSACTKEYYGNDEYSAGATYTYSGKYVRNYFTLLCKISKSTPGFFPPEVARAYGYVGIANYEAVVKGIPGAQSLGGQLNGLAASDIPQLPQNLPCNWGIASNAATADMMRKMFSKKITAVNAASIDSTEQANLKEMSVGSTPEMVSRSIQFGKQVAEAIYNYSLNDGGHEAYLDPFQLPYNMPPDPSCWVPTNATLHPISPYWGNNRPFIQASTANTQLYQPTQFSTSPTSDFYKGALEVYNQVKRNTPQQVEITKYWSDDPFNTCTPTGHTFNIITQLLEENNATLEKSSVAYAKLCIAENDAFVSCWKLKYKSVLIRPVSYIKQYIDPSFATVIGTPAFPAFTSGHSVEIGAGSKVFNEMFTNGSGDYNFTDYSQLQYGFAARHYNNFNEMAEECANSRLYGGIHYAEDNVKGLEQGRAVGSFVINSLNWPKNIR